MPFQESVERVLESVREKTGNMEGRICLTRQILLPPAARMHRHSGQLRHVPTFSFRFLLQLLRAVSGHFTSRHCPARSRKILDFSCCIRTEDKASFLGGLLKVGSGFVLAYLSYMHVRSMYVGDRSIQVSFWPFSMNGNPLNNTEFTILTNQIP